MGTPAHLRRDRGVFYAIVTCWIAASTLTISRPIPAAHAATTNAPEATSPGSSGTPTSTPVRTEEPAGQRDKRGILPPWHDNWIPEMRHQPGKPTRKTTA